MTNEQNLPAVAGLVERRVRRWEWMMTYCKNKRIPPAQKWAWDMAEDAYKEFLKTTHNSELRRAAGGAEQNRDA